MSRLALTSSSIVIVKKDDSEPCIDIHTVQYIADEGWYCHDCGEYFEDDPEYAGKKIRDLIEHCGPELDAVIDSVAAEVEEECRKKEDFSEGSILEVIRGKTAVEWKKE